MGEIQHLQCLCAHEKRGRERSDAIVAEKQVAELY